MPCPSRKGARPFAATDRGKHPFHSIWNELERFELWKHRFVGVQAVPVVLCVLGRGCPRWGRQQQPHCAHGAGGIGVAPSETQAPLVAVAVPQGRGAGMGWGVMSSWFRPSKPGTLLPQPGGVICIYKLVVVLSAVEMQADLLFSPRLSCFCLYNKLLWGKKTKECEIQSLS